MLGREKGIGQVYPRCALIEGFVIKDYSWACGVYKKTKKEVGVI